MKKRLIIGFCIWLFLFPGFIFSDSVIHLSNTPDTYFQLALKNYLNEDYAEALRMVRQCLILDPANNKASKLLPLILKRQDQEFTGQKEKADSFLVEEHLRLGVSYYIMGQFDKAMEEMEKVLEISPGHKKAKDFLDKIAEKTRPKEEYIPPLLPSEKAKERISMNFKDADIKDVLNTFSQLYQLNIISSDDVSGNINISFVDVSLEDALRTIFKTKGYSYKVEGGVIYLYKEDENAIITKTIQLKNSTLSQDQIDKLKDALSGDGKIFYDLKTRILMVTETAKNMKTIEELVQNMDFMRKQVLIEARVLDINLNNTHNLGVDWTLGLSLKTTAVSRPVTFPFVSGGSSIFNQFMPLAKPEEVGVDVPASGKRSELPFSEKDNFTLGTLTGPSLGVLLNALQSNTDTTVLSNPRIIAMDEEEAKIVVGTNYPVPTFERNETTGNFEITGYEEKEIGIVLTVTPRIFENDKITLNLHPEVSAISGYLSADIPYPIISTREAQTTVNVKNGDTLVLGGLISEKDVETLKKIPLLGNIPFFGSLFRNRDKSKEKTELLVFITVNIVPS